MVGRYDRDLGLDFSDVAKPAKPRRPRHDPVQDMLRLGGSMMPGIGTVAGGVIGGLAGGGAGALPGAAIGGAAGAGLGTLMGGGADMMGRDEEEAAERQRAKDEEEAAQHNAALRMLQGLG